MDHLALYSRNCKFCKHLDKDEPKTFNCHFSKGNKDCPAQEVQLVVVGKALRLARAVKKAQSTGDLSREAKILEMVAQKSAAFQFKFKENLK